MSLKVNIREIDGVHVVAVAGRLTLGESASSLAETIRGMVAVGEKTILLDLANVSYLDSAGIGVLVSAFATLTNRGGQLKLMNLTTRVKDLLVITKLCTVFEVYDAEETALRSFKRPAVATFTARE
jgi:anti-sigma B factor antagonist